MPKSFLPFCQTSEYQNIIIPIGSKIISRGRNCGMCACSVETIFEGRGNGSDLKFVLGLNF